jgi:hypothetical protein
MDIQQLYTLISAVAPIDGVNSDGVISFLETATTEQRAAAQAVMDANIGSLGVLPEVLTVPSVTVTAPGGLTVTLPEQQLTVGATLADTRTARMALIRERRNALLDQSNISMAKGVGTLDLGLQRQAGEWRTKLQDLPPIAQTALDALTTNAEIAAYTPDYTPPAYVYRLTAKQFFTTLFASGYLTETEASDRTALKPAIATAFASLGTVNEGLAKSTWATFTTVAEDEALVPLVTTALGVAPEDVHAFFVAAAAT